MTPRQHLQGSGSTAGEPQKSDSALTLRLFGKGVTEETCREAGEAMASLLEEVGRTMGADGLKWELGPIRRACDGCGSKCPTLELPAGWVTAHDGNDYCPSCLHGGER